jgi:putative ABC transport system permease protein
MGRERQVYRVLRGLAAVALGLAVLGLFSVVAYTVEARTREFGLRLALGARAMDLHWQVLRRAIATIAIGAAAGSATAIVLGRFMRALLFETKSYDAGVHVAVIAILVLASVIACWLPARRAAKTDPMIALRAE